MPDTAYAALKLLDQRRRAENRDAAKESFEASAAVAKVAGFVLRCHSDAHYALHHPESSALLDIFPGPQRLKVSRGRWARYELPCPWTLFDVVSAVIQAKDKEGHQ